MTLLLCNSTKWDESSIFYLEGSFFLYLPVCLSLSNVNSFCTQQAYGMSALPLELLVGKKSVKKERLAVHSRVEAAESRRQAIMEKVERRRK